MKKFILGFSLLIFVCSISNAQVRLQGLKGFGATGYYMPNGAGGSFGYRTFLTSFYALEPAVEYSFLRHSESNTQIHRASIRINNYYTVYNFKTAYLNVYGAPLVIPYQKVVNLTPLEELKPKTIGSFGGALGAELESYTSARIALAIGAGQRFLWTGHGELNRQLEAYVALRFLSNGVNRKRFKYKVNQRKNRRRRRR
ncbi:hypothetical protein [Xanthovirga aplysinae]|uniref:hypothetical protein n=1 Tax=Xanthovirga aplysinae TaxID=2529853 RepID=UPI0012BC13E3|nr:hypothetical protein [Xanthovirga aplysinae]MTI33307.1 hypothetical protein [Xanthovirga aplysinae]